ncbi:BTAD domain-containing putative transcriptional regulator [Microbacterium sp. CFBP9034]|uniref:nSTAND1 domain-containing NTPase n=1 Tax=Microbacterium sp. CFBP9034 TaxID=3096540 RepID=UPI002A6A63ED|nr:BTAD domain-containing putative transcriptional regulator [Microbacterium sp. CFBP9034]MDY0909421.1 BTAD domain-containing putative transcriptional regulator [Microbacterium sp. CFBP9034]
MVVRVLGPLETGSGPLSPRERAILSALIVRLGVALSPSQLAEVWWPETPPSTWEQQIRNSIARIRGRLGPASVQTVVGPKYRLSLEPDQIDAGQFERLVSSARGHVIREEHDRAIDAYRRALGLWRGAPLPDVGEWEPGVVEAMRLGEIRTSAEEELLDARLATGEGRAVIADAERLLREDPLRETRWAILALANYRAERQAEALSVLRSARERLADELGIEPGPRLTALELAMLRRDPSLDAPAAVPVDAACPYPGLRAFGPENADLFFGRESDIELVLERLAPRTIVAIAGASGTGKSSLLRAGVLPRLSGRGVIIEVIRPAGDGVIGLRRAATRTSVLAVDQAEELLSASAEDIRQFCEEARSFLDDGGTVLLTVRSDALDRMRALPGIGEEIGRGIYLLGPLSDEAFRSAITEPARRAGLRLEAGLVELAVRDGGDRSSTLPHLSHAMQSTWMRREGATLTVDGYRESGGIAGAIAVSAEDAFHRLSAEDQSVCRSLLLRLVERGLDGVSARRQAALAPLLSDPDRRRVIEALADARLLALDGDRVTVAHEAIATAWPRLHAWLEEDIDGARTLRAVESASAAWEAGGRSDDDLLRGARLHSALEWREDSDPDLTPSEDEFLASSRTHEDIELREMTARAAHERSRNRILRIALSGAAILLIAALVAGGIAVVQGRESATSAENARIEALVATSLALRATDREAGALLAAETYRRWPDDGRVRAALMGTMTSAGGLLDTHHTGGGRFAAMAMIPGTGTALRVTDVDHEEPGAPEQGDVTDVDIDVVDVATGAVARSFDVGLPAVAPQWYRNVEVSRDGGVAVIQSAQLVDAADPESCCWNHVAFLDLGTGDLLPGSQVLRMRTSTVIDLGDRGDVAYLVHPTTGDLIAVDVRSGAVRASRPEAFADHTGESGLYSSVAVLDEERVATGIGDRIAVFDRSALTRVAELPLEIDAASGTLARDGSGGIVASGNDAVVRVDVDEGKVLWTHLTSPGARCVMLTVTRAGTVACSSPGGITELDLGTGVPTGRQLAVQLDTITDVEVIDDRTLLVSSTTNALWMRWRLDASGPVTRLVADGRHVIEGPDSDGDLIVTIPSEGGEFRLWDVVGDRAVGAPAPGMTLLGGDVVEVYNGDDRVWLRRLDTGEEYPYRIPGLTDEFGLASGGWGPLAFVAFDGMARAFDPRTGRPVGAPMVFGTGADYMQSASETPDSTRAALTWWDGAEARTETAVFDIQTGQMLVRGLFGLDQSQVVGSGELITVSDEAVQRVDLATLEARTSLSRATGGSQSIVTSLDGKTMLTVGWNNELRLYDLTSNVVLGDPIDADVADMRGGYLTADGLSLIANVAPDGVAVWNLDPLDQARAACGLAGRELTDYEWATYFPGEERLDTCALLTAE